MRRMYERVKLALLPGWISVVTLDNTASRLLRSHFVADDGLIHLHVAPRRTSAPAYELVLYQYQVQ
jgi:hypothetical protein